MGTGAPIPGRTPDEPCPECGTTYHAEQAAAVTGELRAEVAQLRADLAPIIRAFAALMTIPKVAKQLKNAQPNTPN